MHSLSFKSKCLYDSEQKPFNERGYYLQLSGTSDWIFLFENRDARIIVHTLVQ